MNKLVSFVVPSFNEELNIREVYKALTSVIAKTSYRYEIIYIDNGSTDGSFDIYKELANKDDNVRAITYSRNFGYQMALKGGIDNAKGDCVVCIDGDLQDPPELILGFLQKWEEGFDVVYGIRKKRKGSQLMAFTYKLYYKIANSLSDISLPPDASEFALIDRKIAAILKALPEMNLYLRGLRYWCGFKQTGIEYTRNDRERGKTKFNFARNLELALDGITGFSNKPLKMLLYMGLICIFISLLLMIYTIVIRLFYLNIASPGWASILIAVVFFGGVQLFSLGIMGQYIGRIFTEVKQRPKYIINEIIENNKNA